jgi:hypothetical protein
LPRSARNDTLRGNPKPEALNPEQYQRANIKTQNDKLKCKNLPHFCPLHFDNVVAQFIGQLCLMNQATTKPGHFAFCFPEIATPRLQVLSPCNWATLRSQ